MLTDRTIEGQVYVAIGKASELLDVPKVTIRRLAETQVLQSWRDPNNGYLWLSMSSIREYQNQRFPSQPLSRHQLAKVPRSPEQPGRAEFSETELQRIASGTREFRYPLAAQLTEVRRLLAAGHVKEARRVLDAIPRLAQESILFKQTSAECLWKEGRVDELRDLVEPLRGDSSIPAQAIVWLFDSRIGFSGTAYQEAPKKLAAFLGYHSDEIDPEIHAKLATRLGQLWFRLAEFDKAGAAFQESLDLFKKLGHEEGVADCLLQLAGVSKSSDQWRKAIDLTIEAKDLYGRLDIPPRLMIAWNNLGSLQLFLGWFGEAETSIKTAQTYATSLRSDRFLAVTAAAYGLLCIRTERWVEAEDALKTAWSKYSDLQDPRGLGMTCEYQGELALRRGRHEEAKAHLEKAIQLGSQGPDLDVLGEATRVLAEVELALGNTEAARSAAERALDTFLKMKDEYETAVARRVLGQIEVTLGLEKQAQQRLEESRAFLDKIEERFESRRAAQLLDQLKRISAAN